MKHLILGSNPEKQTFKYCVLVTEIRGSEIVKEYLTPFGLDPEETVVIDLYKTGKKTPAKVMKEYTEELISVINDIDSEYVICGDSDYYKLLTGEKKAEANLGYLKPLKGTDDTHVVYVPNYRTVFYDPSAVRAKIAQSMQALLADQQGVYDEPGLSVPERVTSLVTVEQIKTYLQGLIWKNQPITCDIEGFSLKHYDAGIGTIGFSTGLNDATVFSVDLFPEDQKFLFDPEESRREIRALLKDFFIAFPNRIIFHNASYDATVLIYQLFMDHLEDTVGLLYGLEVFMEKIEDSKLVAYLALNSCAEISLGLKPLSQEYVGNYAIDEITDITSSPIDKLHEYNGIDCIGTWYVWDKYYPIMVQDQQEEVYRTLFRPALADIIQMQLTGMPLDPVEVQKAKRIMEKDRDQAIFALNHNYHVQEYVHSMREQWVIDKNEKLKKKRVTLADAPDLQFNPGSPVQLQELLFTRLGLPSLAQTATKQASTKGDVLEALIHKTDDQRIKDILQAVIDFKDVNIILTTFISAFEKAVQGPSGQWYLFGFFNLGGTQSGRLSSNGPNLQNIPATGSKYAKVIKKCFRCIKGKLFVGLDFASLEDRISALTTKDPNKLKVYTDGFDGHSLRAHFYFGEDMPDIDPNSVESINSIAKKYKGFRQDSKVPTFLLTYGGTYMGIMDKMGWSMEKALMIETRYHDMYKVSDDWVQAKLDQAAKDGYITAAFGLRVRTPLLQQVIRGSRVTPYEAEAEGRSAGNALGQSWGLLNTRAVMAFMQKVRQSKWKYSIRPCAQIHDANYYIIDDDPELLIWMNEHLVNEVKWQDHPEIWHDQVKLGGELSVFYPSWADELSLPNQLDAETLSSLCHSHIEELEKEGIL